MAGRAMPSVLQDVIKGFVAEEDTFVTRQQLPSGLPSFIPAKAFEGAHLGYYFGTTRAGTGYHWDPRQGLSDAEVAKAVGARSKEAPVQRKTAEELLEEAEQEAGDQVQDVLDARGLKRLVLSFTRKYQENLEMRTRYPDQPDKFMSSELDLDEETKKLMAIAGSPELYPDLVQMEVLPTMLALLTHANTDIVADVIEVLEDLTDADVVEDNAAEARVLVDAILAHDGLHQLVHRLRQFKEANPEEAAAVQKMLGVFENMVEVKPEVADLLVAQGDAKAGFLRWMLDRLKSRELEGNKQVVSELLSILMQTSAANQERLASMHGLDMLLQAVAQYRVRDLPTAGEEEREFLANAFQTLCSCLMPHANKVKFVQAEGLELMLMILRAKNAARAGALKALDFALTRCAQACERFVDMYGLKAVFSIFMGKAKVRHKDAPDTAGEEEHALSIIASLFAGLRGSKQTARRDRVAAKFAENEFEKCDRLVELFQRYFGRLVAEQDALAEQIEAGDEIDEEEVLSRRMDAGLYALQQCALIMGHLWLLGDQGVMRHILTILHQRSHTLGTVREVLRELRLGLGEEGDAAERERQQDRVRRMLLAMGAQEDELDEELAEQRRQQAKAEAAVEQQQMDQGGEAVLANGADHVDGLPAAEANGAAGGAAAPPLPPEDLPAPLLPAQEAEPAADVDVEVAAETRQAPEERSQATAEVQDEAGKKHRQHSSRTEERRHRSHRDGERDSHRDRDRQRESGRDREKDSGRDRERDRERRRRRDDDGRHHDSKRSRH